VKDVTDDDIMRDIENFFTVLFDEDRAICSSGEQNHLCQYGAMKRLDGGHCDMCVRYEEICHHPTIISVWLPMKIAEMKLEDI